jgi:argininosuccinate lyase
VSGTGRLIGELGPRTQRIIYGDLTPTDLAAEMPAMLRIDRAHVVMLAAQKLISPEAAAQLLKCMADLTDEEYRPLRDRPAPRGIYLMYEGYLVERLGANVGGVLHTGRSRNDIKATQTSLRLREALIELGEQAVRLQAILLGRARAHRSTVMPIYTHYQAAMPVTYGYYLLGVALAVGREVDAMRDAAASLATCPLGASAVAGTELPIDPTLTAALLGFDAPVRHALDAVASRDIPLRTLAAAASLTVTLSRLAADLQLWSTVEFGFVAFPDRLVGGSSAMPQKRNAFLLEHIKAKAGHAIGAWTAAASAAAKAPFTNSIEVGTEAVGAIWPGLRAALDAVLLSQVVALGARPVPERMAGRAEDGFTAATSIANRLVARGIPFRTAHHMVGVAVRNAIDAGSTDLAAFLPAGALPDAGPSDFGALVRAQSYGGGPGDFDDPHRQAVADWADRRRWLAGWRRKIARANARLDSEIAALVGADQSRPAAEEMP